MANKLAKEMKKARQMLDERPALRRVTPRQLVLASSQLNKSLAETLNLIARLLTAGQGMGGAPIARRLAELEARGK